MNSVQTIATNYIVVDKKCIAQVAFVAEKNGFRIYVAWEWENMAKSGIFGFTKSATLFKYITPDAIIEAANFGWDISETEEVKRVFANMF